MDFLALGRCRQPICVSSEHSCKHRFSRFFSFIPTGARLFCLGVLALLLTLPCAYRVGAVTFAFSGFQESDVYMVRDNPWTFDSNTSSFYFDPPEASWNESVPGRFLYPDLVQMKDPVTNQVKSFSTTFIYQIQIQQANSSTFGPGMSFLVVPDNVTMGAAEDFMGLFTADTSTSAKSFKSDNHTLGVELDTFRNPEFHDPSDNHIGVNLASMNSTYSFNTAYPLCSVVKDVYTQIWIDYFEADSRMDISIALYGIGKPAKPQGSQTGVDLSLLLENMYLGFSTAKGIESDNVPYVYAWSFSNDGILAPPIVMVLNATLNLASPPADVPQILQILATPLSTPLPPLPQLILMPTSLKVICVDLIALMIALLLLGTTFFIFMCRWRRRFQPKTWDPHPMEGEKCRKVVTSCCNERGIPTDILYKSERDENDKLYTDTVCMSFASNLCWTKTTTLQRITAKRRRLAYQRVGKEIGVMAYINKLVRLLFAFSGILIILFSIILNNLFNDKPVRFTAFAILAFVKISLGFLASGWFPRIPLQFIAYLKQCGFLQHVVACSPWHDNVVTNFCGKICTLEPLEQDKSTRLFEFPMSIQNFLFEGRFPPQRTTLTTFSQFALHTNIQDCQAATSPLEIQGQDVQKVFALNLQSQDFKTNNDPDQAFMDGIIKRPHVDMAIGQVSSPNLQEAPSRVEDIIVETHHSPLFNILGDGRAPILEFDGPEIKGFSMKIQAFKNTSTRDPTFDLSCSFRNKKTRRMSLTTQGLSNMVQNMCQWVKIPYPIVEDESSDILHFMAIQDILWVFSKRVYNFKSTCVKHRFVAGLENDESMVFVLLTLVSVVMSIISLVSDKPSKWFLLFLIVPMAYALTLMDISYYFRSLLCPIYVEIFGFNRLYKSKSSFIWCNEFRKKRIVNPESFWIDQECANKFLDTDSLFDTNELVVLPGNPFRGESFKIACQGWPNDDPTEYKKQHDYELEVKFDTFNPGDTCYTSVRLSFSENGDPLGTRIYSSVEIQRLQMIEKLFYCYSNPSFGGYIEAIRPCSWSQSYLGNCLRFINICDEIITCSPMSIPWKATTRHDSQFIIGVSF